MLNFRLRPQGYMDKNEGWDLVEIIGKYFNQLARERFSQSPYFGIMVDETTDISTTTQLIIYIKYLTKSIDNNFNESDEEYKAKIEYLDMVIPESGAAIHIKVLLIHI